MLPRPIAALCLSSWLALSAGCGAVWIGAWEPARYAASVNGQPRLLSPAEWPSARGAVVASSAADDLRCPVAEVVVEPHAQTDVARGCGRAVVEAVVSYLDRDLTRHVAVVPVSNGGSPDTYLGSFGASVHGNALSMVGDEELRMRRYVVDRLVLLERVVAAGAYDLSCPAGEVAPEIVPGGEGDDTPLADGCGKRAAYLLGPGQDLRLVSRVDLAPPGR